MRQAKQPDTMARKRAPRRRLFAYGAALIFVCLSAWAVFAPKHAPVSQPPDATQKQREAYHTILKEPHTGTRLARLKDYISAYPASPYSAAARAQYAALSTHEASAWAQVSGTLYDLQASDEDKDSARNAYVEQWGVFTHSDPRKNAKPTAPETNSKEGSYTYKRSQSPYAKGSNAGALAGAPPSRAVQAPSVIKRAPQKPRRPAALSSKVRPRKAATPIYPRRAKRRHIDAVVVLSLSIDDKGRVQRSVVVRAEASRYKSEFIRAARRAARRSRFYPKTINGRPVPSQGYQRIYKFQSGD